MKRATTENLIWNRFDSNSFLFESESFEFDFSVSRHVSPCRSIVDHPGDNRAAFSFDSSLDPSWSRFRDQVSLSLRSPFFNVSLPSRVQFSAHTIASSLYNVMGINNTASRSNPRGMHNARTNVEECNVHYVHTCPCRGVLERASARTGHVARNARIYVDYRRGLRNPDNNSAAILLRVLHGICNSPIADKTNASREIRLRSQRRYPLPEAPEISEICGLCGNHCAMYWSYRNTYSLNIWYNAIQCNII